MVFKTLRCKIRKVKIFLKKHAVCDTNHANKVLNQSQKEYSNISNSILNHQPPPDIFMDKQITGYMGLSHNRYLYIYYRNRIILL